MNKTVAVLAGLAVMGLHASLRAEPIEKAAAKGNSALIEAREDIQKKIADAKLQPVTCQNPKKAVEIDFSGKDGYSGPWGENGENADAVILILRADPAASVLEVKAYKAKEPKKSVDLQLCLPLQKKIEFYAAGGDGGSGLDAVCEYRNGSWEQVRPAGNGGDGGNGGNVTVYYSHPELLKIVSVENHGGWGGRGGSSFGCSGGSGMSGFRGTSGKTTYVQGEPPPAADLK